MRKVLGAILVVFVFGIVFVSFGSEANAADDAIYACSDMSTGVLRMVGSLSECKRTEKAVSWNIAGPQGPQGPAGPKGKRGNRGAVGPQGEAGLQGPAGPKGNRGAQGPAGAQGETGPAGAQGATGPAGAQGATGPAGAQGETGPAGAQGETGPAGAQGATGPAGAQGETGPAGAQGATGPAGAQGETGPAGPAGTSAQVYDGAGQFLGHLVDVQVVGGERIWTVFVPQFSKLMTLTTTDNVTFIFKNASTLPVIFEGADCTGTAYTVNPQFIFKSSGSHYYAGNTAEVDLVGFQPATALTEAGGCTEYTTVFTGKAYEVQEIQEEDFPFTLPIDAPLALTE